MIQFLTPLANLATSFLDRKLEETKGKAAVAKAKAEAEAEVMKTAATHDSKWELIMAESTKGSWKDEAVTIVVLVPVIMCFIPGTEELVKSGFDRLNELPDWYQYLLYLVCSAALGIKGLDRLLRK